VTRIVTPQEFVTAFACTVDDPRWEKKLYELFWKGLKWGELFCGEAEGVLAEIARILDLRYKSEYLKIDAFMYERVEVDDHFGIDIPVVVLEDEGKRDASYWEMNKLSMLNAPLKVLVTYPNNQWDEQRLLEMYKRILELQDFSGDFTLDRKQLVIFGYHREDAVRLGWRFYLYGQEGFETLSPWVAVFKALRTSGDSIEAEEIGRFWFDGEFRHTGFEGTDLVESILQSNAQLGDRIYTASDSEAFVKVLPMAFHGTYLWAELEPVEAMEQLRLDVADHRAWAENEDDL
jgi:hypothetical protein